MIVKLHRRDIQQLIAEQGKELIVELNEDGLLKEDDETSEKIVELILEHLDALYANIQFKHERVAAERKVPEILQPDEDADGPTKDPTDAQLQAP